MCAKLETEPPVLSAPIEALLCVGYSSIFNRPIIQLLSILPVLSGMMVVLSGSLAVQGNFSADKFQS